MHPLAAASTVNLQAQTRYVGLRLSPALNKVAFLFLF